MHRVLGPGTWYHETRDGFRTSLGSSREDIDQLAQREICLANEGVIDSVIEVGAPLVAYVGAGRENGRTAGTGHLAHPKGGQSAVPEAHLVEKIELIFVQDDDARSMGVELRFELVLTVGKHGIEYGHRVPSVSQRGGGIKRAERRVRPHLFHLLGVVL